MPTASGDPVMFLALKKIDRIPVALKKNMAPTLKPFQSKKVPNLQPTANQNCRYEQIADIDIRVQAIADFFCEIAEQPRVIARLSEQMIRAGEKSPLHPPFGRYILPDQDFPILTMIWQILGQKTYNTGTVLIAERLRQAPTSLIRALIAHEIGHHCSREQIIKQRRDYAIWTLSIPILLFIFAVTLPIIGTLTHNELLPLLGCFPGLLLVIWYLKDYGPGIASFEERQRLHWERLADYHAQRLYGRGYRDAIKDLQMMDMDEDEYLHATMLDRNASAVVRQTRTKRILFKIWRRTASLRQLAKAKHNKIAANAGK